MNHATRGGSGRPSCVSPLRSDHVGMTILKRLIGPAFGAALGYGYHYWQRCAGST